MARVLAPLLKTNEAYLVTKLQPRVLRFDEKGQPVMDKYVPLKHKVKAEEWEQIQAGLKNATFGMVSNPISRAEKATLNDLRQHAIFTEAVEDQLRLYPNQTLAAHLLGYLGADGNGQDGAERIMNDKLCGVRGWRQTERDRRGRGL